MTGGEKGREQKYLAQSCKNGNERKFVGGEKNEY